MNILTTILLIIAAVIALLLLVALFLKKHHYVKRQIFINAPLQPVFDFLRFLKNQDKFNKWAKTDPNRKVEHIGEDGTVGYIYRWSGNKSAGEGEKEITAIDEGKRIETEIRFTKPMRLAANIMMETVSISDNQTEVSIPNTGKLPYPLNIMIPLAERNFAKDVDRSLAMLKTILEEGAE